MKGVFSKYNILWIGDTTARQDYTTLYAILNRTNTDVTVLDVDHPRVADINMHNKRVKHEEPCTKREDLVICREISGANLFDLHLRHCAHRVDTSKWQSFWKDYVFGYHFGRCHGAIVALFLSRGTTRTSNGNQHANFAADKWRRARNACSS
jgi:hypothetical protein